MSFTLILVIEKLFTSHSHEHEFAEESDLLMHEHDQHEHDQHEHHYEKKKNY